MNKELLVGIDIGSFLIKTIVAQMTGNEDCPYQIIGVGQAPSKGIRKGVVVDLKDAEESIQESLEAAEKLTGVHLQEAYVSISGDHIDSNSSKGVIAVSRADGEITSEDIDRVLGSSQAVNIPQNKEILHVLPQKYFVDDNMDIKDPIGMTGVRLGVDSLIVQGLMPNIKTLVKVIEDTGIAINGIVVDALSAANSILDKKQKDLGVVLIDIGGNTTSIIVFEDAEIKHLKILPIGSGHITNDIAIGLRTTIEVAEKVKTQFGIANPKEVDEREEIDLSKIDSTEQGVVSRKEVAMIIEARLEEIFRMVNRELQLIERQSLLPSGAVLTGGGARLRGIVDSAKENLRLPAQIGFPAESGIVIDEVDDPLFATPIGLISWQLEHGAKVKKNRPMNFKINFSGGLGKAKDWMRNLLP